MGKRLDLGSFLVDCRQQSTLECIDDIPKRCCLYSMDLACDGCLQLIDRLWRLSIHPILEIPQHEEVTWVQIRTVWWPVQPACELRGISKTEHPTREVLIEYLEHIINPVWQCAILHEPEAVNSVHTLSDRDELLQEHALVTLAVDILIQKHGSNDPNLSVWSACARAAAHSASVQASCAHATQKKLGRYHQQRRFYGCFREWARSLTSPADISRAKIWK